MTAEVITVMAEAKLTTAELEMITMTELAREDSEDDDDFVVMTGEDDSERNSADRDDHVDEGDEDFHGAGGKDGGFEIADALTLSC